MGSVIPFRLRYCGFLLFFHASIASADPPLIIRQGDANFDGQVNFFDAELIEKVLIDPFPPLPQTPPPCLLPNVNVSPDFRFDLRDLLLHSQYAFGVRTPSEVSGPTDPPSAPGMLSTSTGINPILVGANSSVSIDSLVFTEISIDNLPCVDRTRVKTQFSIEADSSNGAQLLYNSIPALTHPQVGTLPDGGNEPIGLLTGPDIGVIRVRSALYWSRADGSLPNSLWVEFLFEIPGVCGDGIPDWNEFCDDGDNNNCTPGCNSTCTGLGIAAICGNGVVQCDEACDDGDTDDCTTDCNSICTGTGIAAVCGDGIRCGAEECDDGNADACDGCSPICRIECGDGEVQCAEICDDGNADECDACHGDCTANTFLCGDGYVCGPESCDDGNADACDGCSAICQTETGCGDGSACGTEACDDGNTTPCDGCSASCKVETGCGDGSKCGTEACDDGNTDDCDGCRADCLAVETGCGDGYPCLPEECDDGNGANCDACSNACKWVTGCGDGAKCGAEACDDGNGANCDICSSACKWVTGCGDGANCGEEACDDGNGDNCDNCHNNCTDNLNLCGDGFRCGTELCDDDNTSSNDGCTAACSVESGWICNSNIGTAPSVCQKCGNGKKEGTEACDDGMQCSDPNKTPCTVDADCAALGDLKCRQRNYDGCSVACLVEWTWNCIGTAPSVCYKCGDNHHDPGEECDDGTNENGMPEDCDDCHNDCTINTYSCGDGHKCGQEQCDAGGNNSDSGCICSADCMLPYCGDGLICGNFGETCDSVAGCLSSGTNKCKHDLALAAICAFDEAPIPASPLRLLNCVSPAPWGTSGSCNDPSDSWKQCVRIFGAVCAGVKTRLKVPAITSMHEENPGVEIYRENVPIIPSGDQVSHMRSAMPRLAALALKLANGASLGPADIDGYLPTGLRLDDFAERTGAQRMVDMLVARLSGTPFASEVELPKADPVPPAAPLSDIAHKMIAIVTSSGRTVLKS